MAEIEQWGERLSLKLGKFEPDEKDKKLVNLLNENGRLTLKELAKEVGMSIDGVKGRIDKMKAVGAIKFTVIPVAKFFGYPINSQVYVKLQNITEENRKKFIAYLKAHNKIILVMSVLGDYDVYFVPFAKDAQDLNKIKLEIKEKFPDIISDWREAVAAEVHKYEEYSF